MTPDDLVDWCLKFFLVNFQTKAASVSLAIFITTIPVCIVQKKWPEIGASACLVLGSAGTLAGLKIMVLTVGLPIAQLGPLGDDRPTLLIGGVSAFLFCMRETVSCWRKSCQL